MDYIWKKNWAGRHYMDVHVSPFYEEYLTQKISEVELTRTENDRLNSLRNILLEYQRLNLQPPQDLISEYEVVGKKHSIAEVLRQERLEVNLRTRDQERKFERILNRKKR